MRDFRLIVTGSEEYSDRLSLRTALDKIFDSLPADAALVVVHSSGGDPEEPDNPGRIAREWALELEESGLQISQVMRPGPGICDGGAEWGLVALKVGTQSTEARECCRWMIQDGIRFELVIEGKAAGLPEDLIGRRGQGRPAQD